MRIRRRVIAGLCALIALVGLIAATPATAAPPGKPKPTSLQARHKAVQDTSVPAPCATPKKANYAHCMARVHTGAGHRVMPDAVAPPAAALSPTDIRSAYNLPASGGDGEIIGIVDALGDSTAESDLAAFRSYYGLPPCTTANGCFQKVDQNGGKNYPADDPGWGLETSLDLDAVSAVCPNCHILLVEGTTALPTDLSTAVDTAVRLGAVAVSNSYGLGGEIPDQVTLDQHYDHPGVAITASSGDAGGVINWPASNPTVTAVGGTTLTKNTSSPRGWDETAWVQGGSGCSAYEPAPSFQQGVNTACPDHRADADVSADADPTTGLATYDSLGYTGWLRVGGTSLSSPLVAAMFALAGKPVANTHPVNYLYNAPDRSGVLNDITTGSNSGCGNQLCNAGTGWDGPTGLGTPNGVSAFTLGQHGDFAGHVTDSAGKALAGASLVAKDDATGYTYTATTDAQGGYDMPIRSGRTYDLTASMFGYAAKTTTKLTVAPGTTAAGDFALDTVPSQPLTGTVTDGSGHGYPLYAKITIDGYPHGAIYTDPHTGAYHVDLPQNQTYRVHVTPAAMSGYAKDIQLVDVGTSHVQQDFAVPVDATACAAPGYAFSNRGVAESFEGWSTDPLHGWATTDNNGSGYNWEFDNPGSLGNRTGATGNFAVVASYIEPAGQDATLTSPAADLTNVADPEVAFNTDFENAGGEVGDVDVSLDGGSTWTNIWHQTGDYVHGRIHLPVPQAAGKANVRARFHLTSDSYDGWWEIDDVLIGSRSCKPTTGGLVEGTVTDRNNGSSVNGATVTGAGGTGTSMATPDDAALGDGFYWMYATATGSHQLSAHEGNYQTQTATVAVTADATKNADFSLAAGHLVTTPGAVSVSQPIGAAKRVSVTYTNDGTAPLKVRLGERDGGTRPLARTQAPSETIAGDFRPGPLMHSSLRAGSPSDTTAAGTVWTPVADYPTPVADNEVAEYNGTIYSVDGYDNTQLTTHGYSYTPSGGAWTPIADSPAALEAPTGAFANGRMYMVGGWDTTGARTSGAYAYDPASNKWSQVADLPERVTGATGATLGGQLYILGGCGDDGCVTASKAVYSFDPVAGKWTRHADDPGGGAFEACAAIAGRIICAGGFSDGGSQTSTYSYDPGQDTWTRVADMPYDNYAMAYSGANGMLQVAAGATNRGFAVTNRASQYDPVSDTWSALPNTNLASQRGGSACGLYKIGGANGRYFSTSEVLPGLDSCGKAPDVAWLSENSATFTLAPGASVAVDVTADADAVAQPGDYAADLTATTDSPYRYPALPVTMSVTAPKSWGKITGTVTDAATGHPIAGATITICTLYNPKGTCGPVTYTMRTGADGSYQWWLDKNYNPLHVTAGKDGFAAQFKVGSIKAGKILPVSFALARNTN